MIKRPLACCTVIFILVLLLMYRKEVPLFSHNPVNTVSDGEKQLLGYLQDDVITLYGVISDYSYQKSYGEKTTKLILKDVSVLCASKQYKKITRYGQSILVYINKEETHFIGNTICVSGRLSFFTPATNPGEFDAEKYYKNRDVLFAVKKAVVLKTTNHPPGVRQKLKTFALKQEQVLEKYLSRANATIMKAMLLGNKEELDEEIEKLYQDNGIAHILAISGLHISLLGMAVYRLLRRLPLPVWMPLILSEIFLILYGCMVGFPISSIRAIGMFTFFMMSKLTRRSYDMLTALAFMAMLQLMQHPGYLLDCGFQLSYGAILGIGLLLPAFEKINETVSYPWLRKGISLVLPSLSVTLVTAPILIYHYHELSFFSILLNVIVLPTMSLLLIGTIVMLFFAQVFVPLAKITALLVSVILGFYEYSCRFLECLPVGQKNMPARSGWWWIMYFTLLILLTILVKIKSHPYQFLVAALSLGFLLFPQNPQFTLWITDIGQGDASVIFTKEGKCFVIDCGSTSKYKAGERILIPLLKYHGVDNVDVVFVTHADADHMNGVLELLELGKEENITVETVMVYEQALENEPAKWKELIAAANTCGATVVGMSRGDSVRTQTVTIECLYPLKSQRGLVGNNSSLVLSLEAKLNEDSYSVAGFGCGEKGIQELKESEDEKGSQDRKGAELEKGIRELKESEDENGNQDLKGVKDDYGIYIGNRGRAEYGKRVSTEEDDGIFRALFTGDMELEGERHLLEEYGERIGNYDLLKVGHHGSSGSTSVEFLEWVSPRVSIISCGKNNRYGHPHKETLYRLETIQSEILTTPDCGAIVIREGEE